MNQTHLSEILNILNLGIPVAEPTRVYGGLLHAMWKATTDKGSYAIKQLSQNIDLKDEMVINNYELTESIAHRFSEKGVPAISALGRDGHRLVRINGIGFLVYPWVEPHDIRQTELPYLKIAIMLAKIHLIDLQVPEILEPVFDTHTNDSILRLIRKAKDCNAPFAKHLRNYQDEIITLNETYQTSIPVLKEHVVVSHGDLDQKNVLWVKESPILIDWESARKLNPTYEIINASLDWSGITTNTFNKELFVKMIDAYCAAGGKINAAHVNAAFHGALGNWVNWMLYNINRACTAQELEQKTLGIEQVSMVLPTLVRLREFHAATHEMVLIGRC